MAHAVVIGGGITGLAAAHALVKAANATGGVDGSAASGLTVTVLEADARLGGKILTTTFAGLPVDAGPDAVLCRVPWAVDLFHELGLADELTSPDTGSAFVAWKGRLHPLPEGLVLGVPAGWGLARSRLLTVNGIARAAVEPLLPRTRDADDSVGRLVRARFGKQVHDRLVDPLLGSINAGGTDRLSLAAGAPQLDAVATRSRSLLLGLRRQRKANPPRPDEPVFTTVRSGLGTVVERLAAAITAGGGTIETGVEVRQLERSGRGWLVDGRPADAVVLAAPAWAAATLLNPTSPAAAGVLADIDYASVAIVTLELPMGSVRVPLTGSGVLVPHAQQTHVTACSFASSKWAHWRPARSVLLRASVGRYGDDHALALDDAGLLRAVLADLRPLLGLTAEPTSSRITRWPRSFPQYLPGHLDRVAAVRSHLASDAPGLVAAGAAFEGLGIPACIRQGGEAADAVLAHLATR